MDIKLQTNEQLSVTVANGLSGVFVNGTPLISSIGTKADVSSLTAYYQKSETSSSSQISGAISAFLTAVPSTYKTYSDTLSSLSSNGYLTSADVHGDYIEDSLQCRINADGTCNLPYEQLSAPWDVGGFILEYTPTQIPNWEYFWRYEDPDVIMSIVKNQNGWILGI